MKEAYVHPPMAALMACIGIFGMLEVVPSPWPPFLDGDDRPLVIYDAASAVGAYAVKLANLLNVHLLLCVAHRGISFMKSLVDEIDAILDYRKGEDFVVGEIQRLLEGKELKLAVRCLPRPIGCLWTSTSRLFRRLSILFSFTAFVPEYDNKFRRLKVPTLLPSALT